MLQNQTTDNSKTAKSLTAEERRLEQSRERKAHWNLREPYPRSLSKLLRQSRSGLSMTTASFRDGRQGSGASGS